MDVRPTANRTETGPPVYYMAFANMGYTTAMPNWVADFLLLQLTPQLSNSEVPARSVEMSAPLPAVSV